MDPLPDRRLSPRESVRIAADLFGRDRVVHWAEEFLAGHTNAGDTHYPDIVWLRGMNGVVPLRARLATGDLALLGFSFTAPRPRGGDEPQRASARTARA